MKKITLIVFMLVACLVQNANASEFFESRVSKVLDGDKILLYGGTTVQYMGVEAPGTRDSESYFDAVAKKALEYNKNLVERKKVRLLFVDPINADPEDSTKYAYVYTGGQMVNALLLKKGYAVVSQSCPPDDRFSAYFQRCQNEAFKKKAGMWAQMINAATVLNKDAHAF